MKQKLLTLIFSALISTFVFAQTVGQQDDFEDTTVQGWVEGGGSPNPPTNQVGAPTGRYLNNISTGVGNPGSRLGMYNTTQWTGDYVSSSIKSISFLAKNNSAVAINLRVAFGENSFSGSATHWVSTTPVVLAAGSGWTTVVFPITAPNMSLSVDGGSTAYNTVMGACAIMRILSAATVTHQGDKIAGDLDVDNITANDTFLDIKEQKPENTFSINPNPGSNKLNLKLSRLDEDTTIEIFDVLGKKVYAERLNTNSKSIDVFKWNSGVYLVRITSDDGTQTKRFVKQ